MDPPEEPKHPCPECPPGQLFQHRFLEVPSLTVAGSPARVVYGVRTEVGGVSEVASVAWLNEDYAVQREAELGIPARPGRTRTITELAVAADGAVAALAVIEEELDPGFQAVVMFDAGGQRRWGLESGSGFSTLSVGPRHVFVTIGDTRTVQVGAQVVKGPALVALDRDDGAFAWSRALSWVPGGAFKLRTVPDPSGGVIVSGAFSGALDLGGGVALTGASPSVGFVARLDEHGVGRWGVALDPTDDTPGNGFVAGARVEHLARGPRGEVGLVVSWFGGPLTFKGQTFTPAAPLDGNLIALLDADGNLDWARNVGQDVTTSIVTDGDELVVAGRFDFPLSYDATAAEDEQDGFVAAVTREGPRWVRHARGPGYQTMNVVSYTAAGGITAVIEHDYFGADGPKPATYGDVTLAGSGTAIGELAP